MFTEDVIVLFDTEYTSWEGCIDTGWDEENDQYKELVQIGALKIETEEFSVLSEFQIFVQPKRNPELSEYFKELTEIQQSDVENAPEFSAAMREFYRWMGKGTTCYSYGNDKGVLEYNIDLYSVPTLQEEIITQLMFNDIRNVFSNYGVPVDEYTSGTVSTHFDRTPDSEGDVHNALYDCYSLLEGLRGIKDREAETL